MKDQCESVTVPCHLPETDEKISKETDDDLQTLTDCDKLKTERDEDDSELDDEGICTCINCTKLTRTVL